MTFRKTDLSKLMVHYTAIALSTDMGLPYSAMVWPFIACAVGISTHRLTLQS